MSSRCQEAVEASLLLSYEALKCACSVCADDARGSNAVLTDKGLARLQEAWPTHLASVRRHIFDHLEGIDLAKLATAFNEIASDA